VPASFPSFPAPIVTIYHSERFRGSYKHLDPQIQKAAETQVALFRLDSFDQRLGTQRLHGKLKGFWSFSVDARYRSLFEFLNASHDEVLGKHSLYL
jgi:hypothetical protein